MLENIETFLSYLLSILLAALSFIVKTAFKRIDKLEEEVDTIKEVASDARIDLAKNYITKDDLTAVENRLTTVLAEIKSKL